MPISYKKTISPESRLFLAILLLCLSVSSAWAETFCVSTAAELSSALSTAGSNGEDDTIQVVRGTYLADTYTMFSYFTQENYNLSLLGGYAEGCGSRILDPTNTILDGQDTVQVVRLLPHNYTSGNLVFQGFTVQNGYTTGYDSGAGLHIGGSADHSGDVTADHNIIRDNNTDYIGGGLYGGSDTGVTRIENNLIVNNTATLVHGGASLTSNGTAYLTNNTVYGNTGDTEGGLRLSGGTIAYVSNNIFYGNTDSDLILDSSGIIYENNNIQNQVGTGIDNGGNVSVDPQFQGSDDFRLQATSPLIDAGTLFPGGGLPATDIVGNVRSNGDAPDIGAYEYTEGGGAAGYVTLSGTVYYNGQPACGLVLINGQRMFSCSGDGSYSLYVPLDDNDEVTVYGFASGLAPFKQVFAPGGSITYDIILVADAGSPEFTVNYSVNGPAATKENWVNISGSVDLNGTPICGLVLINGKHMFSCKANLGIFDLDVPLNPQGNITLFVFAGGFKPFKAVFPGGQ
jgi:hypothetical protein